MNTRTLWRRAITVVLVAVLIVGTGGAGPVTAQPAETYATYSMMTGQYAGWISNDAGGPLSVWAWTPTSATESKIRWGSASTWDTDTDPLQEHFRIAGGWVYLDGWEDNGTFYALNMTREDIGDINCNNMQFLSTGGSQHYTKWNIGPGGYCLRGTGTITEQSSGKRLIFQHLQIWAGPYNCGGGDTCITQYEQWSDDNGAPFRMTQDSWQALARGKGPGRLLDRALPSRVRGTLTGWWAWS